MAAIILKTPTREPSKPYRGRTSRCTVRSSSFRLFVNSVSVRTPPACCLISSESCCLNSGWLNPSYSSLCRLMANFLVMAGFVGRLPRALAEDEGAPPSGFGVAGARRAPPELVAFFPASLADAWASSGLSSPSLTEMTRSSSPRPLRSVRTTRTSLTSPTRLSSLYGMYAPALDLFIRCPLLRISSLSNCLARASFMCLNLACLGNTTFTSLPSSAWRRTTSIRSRRRAGLGCSG
mmetsp:Transcript_72596/g.216697  ORF Transcript_72596/g.216697 Transcript_72596/m.216697 type:complete len:236 (+) Transcript_72596:864-1571(+)